MLWAMAVRHVLEILGSFTKMFPKQLWTMVHTATIKKNLRRTILGGVLTNLCLRRDSGTNRQTSLPGNHLIW